MRIAALLSDSSTDTSNQSPAKACGIELGLSLVDNICDAHVRACQNCQRPFNDDASLLAHRLTHPSPNVSKGSSLHASLATSSPQKFISRPTPGMAQITPTLVSLVACSSSRPPQISLNRSNPSIIGEALRPNLCSICELSCSSSNDLRRHMSRNHGQKSRQFGCGKCGSLFQLKAHLETHVATVHDKLRPYTCATCGLAFGLKWNR
jgi:hypothetical protein